MNRDTLLFSSKQVRRYFDVLARQDRACCFRYNNRCGREIFVKRTLNKWFTGKYVILYAISKITDLQYKQYILVYNVEFGLGYSDYLNIFYIDCAQPTEYKTISLYYNDVLNLEGEWCENTKHLEIIKLTQLDLPEQEFVLDGYNWKKYEEGKSEEENRQLMKITVSFKARTQHELKKEIEKFTNNPENLQIMLIR
jgi:hypothetical protein